MGSWIVGDPKSNGWCLYKKKEREVWTQRDRKKKIP